VKVSEYSHGYFSRIFNGLFSDRSYECAFKFVALPVPEIIGTEVLGGGFEPQSWEQEAVGGQGWYRSKERR